MNDLQFGIAMKGCGGAMLNAIDSIVNPERPFLYMELGIAEGRTLTKISAHLASKTNLFHCIGVDIEDGWSLNMQEVVSNTLPFADKVDICLLGSTFALSIQDDHTIDFLLIDACHSRECCARDFINAVTKIRPGGFVAFHDTAPFAQGVAPQPHCNQLCNVMEALMDLNLIGDHRPGWHLHTEVHGEPTGDNNGMMIFKKE